MIYKAKNFIIQELVSPDLYSEKGDSSWKYLDAYLLHDLDIIRDHVFKETGQGLFVNDWLWNGQYSQSGLRTPESLYYNPLSGHTLGKAYDIKLEAWLKGDYSYDADWLRSLIYRLKSEGLLKYTTEIETETDTWVHIGSRNVEPNHKGLYVFAP